MENRLEDLWSLMNFIQPGLLGPLDYFCKEFCQKILKGADAKAGEDEKLTAKKMTKEIHRRLQQHMLRRTKQNLASKINVPDRNEFIVRCPLTKLQLDVYTSYLQDALKLLGKDKHLTSNSLPIAYMVV